jgi:hypothetical protein
VRDTKEQNDDIKEIEKSFDESRFSKDETEN